MPANFTEEQRQEIREKLITVGYDLIREMGLKKMKVSIIAEREHFIISLSPRKRMWRL